MDGPPVPGSSELERWWRRAVRDARAVARRPSRALPILAGLFAGVLLTLTAQCAAGSGSRPLLPLGPLDQNPDLTVSLSNGLLAALIQQSIARGQSPVALENVRVVSGDQRLIIQGDVPMLGNRVNGVVEVQPVVESGALRMRVLRTKLGPLRVPGNVGQLAEGPINEQITAATNKLPSTVTSARVTAEGLIVTARVNTAGIGTRQ